MQLEIGMSTSRYFPASGTAGLARSFVKGKSRVPAPPPIITASTLLVFGDMRLPCVIKKGLSARYLTFLYLVPPCKCKRLSVGSGYLGSRQYGKLGQR